MFIVFSSLLISICFFAIIYIYFNLATSIILSLIIFFAIGFFLYKIISDLLEKKFSIIQRLILQGHYQEAVELLKIMKNKYKFWHFFLVNVIDGQIGSIYYIQEDYKKAETFLENSYKKLWISRTMLAIIQYKNKDYKKMDLIFADIVKQSPTQELLWSVWSYCKYQSGYPESAINILIKGKEKIIEVSNHFINNISFIKNKKKMKMKNYGDQWYQFNLEQPINLKNNKVLKKRIRLTRK